MLIAHPSNLLWEQTFGIGIQNNTGRTDSKTFINLFVNFIFAFNTEIQTQSNCELFGIINGILGPPNIRWDDSPGVYPEILKSFILLL